MKMLWFIFLVLLLVALVISIIPAIGMALETIRIIGILISL